MTSKTFRELQWQEDFIREVFRVWNSGVISAIQALKEIAVLVGDIPWRELPND